MTEIIASGQVCVRQQQNGNEINPKRKKKMFKDSCQHSASSPWHSVPTHLFLWLFASEEISVSERLQLFFMALWCSPFRDAEMHCSYPGLRIYVLFVDAEESTGLNDEQAASAPLPIKKLIVCPSRKGNDCPPPLPGPAHLSCAHQLKRNCFWLCLRAYGALGPSLHISVNSNSPPFGAFLHLETIFSPNWRPSLKPERKARFHRSPRFSPFTCAFLSWELKAVFVKAKLENNLVMTSLRLYVQLEWLKLPANIPIVPLAIGAWKASRRKPLCYCK